ncbi:MAG: restriction endonuclease subunit S [Euryarchaeota archaeon]|nr:restriction endonuclease subunit S [Euryarchaeota archaeon]
MFKGSGSRFQNGDTLLARITPCLENGKTAHVNFLEDGEIAHGSTEFIVLSGIEGMTDNLFVYYLTRSPEFRDFAIVRMEGSSGRQRVPAPTLKRFTFACPPLPEQRAIAHILGSLDDKIELNRRMNETLEAMAQAIFKSWLVDFDPVRAKTEGRDTGLPKEIADLFPDSFEESELGAMPEGWKQSTIRDEFDITMGQSPPGSTYNETGAGLPFFQWQRDFGFRYPANRVYCTAPKRIAEHSDILVSVRAPGGGQSIWLLIGVALAEVWQEFVTNPAAVLIHIMRCTLSVTISLGSKRKARCSGLSIRNNSKQLCGLHLQHRLLRDLNRLPFRLMSELKAMSRSQPLSPPYATRSFRNC